VLRKIRENASQSELLQGASNVKKRSPEVFSAGSDTSSKRRRTQYEIFQSDQNVDFTKEIQLSSIELDVLGHRKLDYGTNSIFFRENISRAFRFTFDRQLGLINMFANSKDEKPFATHKYNGGQQEEPNVMWQL